LRFPEWKEDWLSATLDSICSFSKGSVLSKAHLSDDGLPCILYGQLYTTYLSEEIGSVLSRTKVSDPSIERSNDGDVIIPCSGETPEDIATARCIRIKGILYGGDLNVLKPRQHDGVFLAFQLNGRRRMDIAKIAVGKTIVHLHASDLKHLRIWFPKSRLEEEKIARFLSLINRRIELQNKIIETYSSLINPLFDRLHEGLLMEPTRLMDVAIIKKGEQINGDMMDDSNEFPMLNGGTTPSGFFAKSNRTKETIAISEGGNSCGYVSFMSTPFWAGGHCYTVHPASCGNVLNKYLFYSLKRWEREIMSLRVGSGLPNIQKSDLGNFIFNIPPKKRSGSDYQNA